MDSLTSTIVQRCEVFLQGLPEGQLRDESDLDRAILLIDELVDHGASQRPEAMNDVLLALALVIEAYEDIHYPMGDQLEGATDAVP